MEQEKLNTEVVMEKDNMLAFKGIIEVFYKPAEFFKKLKDDPKILVPYVLYVLLVGLSAYLIKDLLYDVMANSDKLRDEMAAQGQTLTPAMLSTITNFALIFIVAFSAIFPLIGASAMLFIGNFVFAGKASFKQLLSVLLYGELLFTIGALVLVIPMMLAKDSIMASLSLSVFVADQGIESLAFKALSKISLFHIWEIIVVGIGSSIIYSFPRNKGYILSVLSIGMLSLLGIFVS